MSWSATLSANSYQSQGFWARQFSAIETERQTRFDAIFGVIVPATLLMIDPFVFQGAYFSESALLGNYQVFAYLLCAIQMGLFLLWRSTGRTMGRASALIGGALLGGAMFSLVMSILMVPFSVIGMIALIGVVGFTPFLTSFVYLRNGIRAIRFHGQRYSFESRAHLAGWSLLLVLMLPYVASAQYSNLVYMAVSEFIKSEQSDINLATSDIDLAAQTLRWFPVIPSTDRQRVYVAYRKEQRAEKRFVLEQYWKDITGEDLSKHARFMFD